MPTAITETKFADLKAKLRELFELDKSDLDFGIYRIMAAKNKEVTDFLDRQLRDVVRQTLATHGAGAAEQAQAELKAAVQHAQELGADPDSMPKVKELRARLGAAGGEAAAELEADIYNHLLAFFSRYYDEGDFISKRRYKGDTYAIPYNGEEVTLYWANKDQYYVKSGEWHKDYRFKVAGKTVHFKLVEATQEANNNKEPDDAKRRYVLGQENPVDSADGELTLRFEFRGPTEAEKQAVAEATRIFGGSFDKPEGRTKGDEREQFCAAAEQRALATVPEAWKAILTAKAPTETKPARTVLGKHLEDFTARNTFDYFIHKDLGGFLNRELDFYIKNEVVRLDDLEALPGDHLARVQGKVRAIRTVAGRIIAFLANIEDFQKKMWLKKKFVLETHYCVTLDRVPDELYGEIAANEAQRAEWIKLFAIDEIKAEKLGEVAYSKPLTAEFLKSQPHLVLDTKHFSEAFKQKLLASIRDLDEKLDGVLIHSENFQALQLLAQRYQERVDCVYIDPPYNAKTSEILYRNTYKHSSWLAMIADRLGCAKPLTSTAACLIIAIDENEQARLGMFLGQEFPAHTLTCVVVVHNKKGIQGRYFSYNSEYAFFLIPPGLAKTRDMPIAADDQDYANLRKWGSDSERTTARNCFFPILVRDHAVVGFGEVCPEEFHPGRACVHRADGLIEVYPIDQNGVERKWRYARDSIPDIADLLRVAVAGPVVQILKARATEKLKTVWADNRYIAGDHGTNVLTNLGFSLQSFSFPKSVYTVRDSILATCGPAPRVLDFFAGSGTTAHAVINLNREDGGSRQYILVEMGEYFHTVLLPRIKKVVYAKDWKDGKPAARDTGISHFLKYFALESYEDALNNLPAPTGELLAHADTATKDSLITYLLDLELGPNLLNLDAFRDPWGYTINAQPAGEAEIRPHRVDLVETFNYLLGLKVKAYGPMERYAADFKQAEHADNLGRLKVNGRLRRDTDGAFVFQRVEGELLDGTRVLVVWRKLTGDAERDAAALEAWMDRHREDTKQRSEHRDYHLIYVNGPITLPQPTAEIRTVLPIEQTFKDRMFEEDKGL